MKGLICLFDVEYYEKDDGTYPAEEFILSQGDTVRILPSRKHKFRNPGAVPVKILFIKSKVNY